MGQTFGSIDSPQDWEPFARARTHLAHSLSHRRNLQTKHDEIITQVEFNKPPSKGVSFTPTALDPCNYGMLDNLRTSYKMFVDNSLFVTTALIIKHAMAANIEALCIVLGFPDLTARQNPLSLDKYSQSVCSYERIQLGKLVKLNSFVRTN